MQIKNTRLAFYDVINNMYTTDVISSFELIFFLDISKIQTSNLSFSRLFVEKQKKLGLSVFLFFFLFYLILIVLKIPHKWYVK